MSEVATGGIIPEDYFRFKCPGDPRISPDGERVVYVVERRDRNRNAIHANLWIADLRDPDPSPLTRGCQRDSSPRWSPDGGKLAFLSDRDGETRIWILDIGGGEAQKICTDVTPVSPPEWSPDGERLLFLARTFIPGEDWITYPGAPEDDVEREKERAAGGDDSDGVRVITRTGYRFDGKGYLGNLRDHAYVVSARPSPEVEATPITSGDFDHGGPPSWSPDGEMIAFTALRREDADMVVGMDLWVHLVSRGTDRQILHGMGSVGSPRWSPDGDMLAFTGHDGRYGMATTTGLWVVDMPEEPGEPLEPGDARHLTEELDRPVGVGGIASDLRCAPTGPPMVWEPGGESLLFLAADGGCAGVYRVNAFSDPVPRRVDTGRERVVSSFDLAGGSVVIQAGDSTRPEEIWALDGEGPDRPVSRMNDRLLEELGTVAMESFDYSGEDGWSLEGFILAPPSPGEGEPIPALLQIHGGPHGAYGHTFSFMSQMLASQGFAVIMTNPRGSQTYGSDFARAVVGDWGGADMGDILAGVDAAARLIPIDRDRLGIGGWSYGGYMTSWIIGQRTDFAAAVVGAPVTDRLGFYGTSDVGLTFGEHQCGGTPWDGSDALLSRSPLSFVHRVETPALLIHGGNDLRCPVAQSEEYFAALKRLGREAALVVYPGESHGIKAPRYVEDRYRRTLEWYRHHLA